MKKLLPLLVLGCASISVFAQEESSATPSGEWEFNGNLAVIGIDSATAVNEGVDDAAYLIGFSVDYWKNGWISSAGTEFIVYDDKQQFNQEVVGEGLFNDGDRSRESSSANAVTLYLAGGYQWRLGEEQDIATTIQAGFSHLFASERSIDLCSNCKSEDIDIDSGLFLKASLAKSMESFSVGLYFQQYLGGDGISNAFGVTIGSAF